VAGRLGEGLGPTPPAAGPAAATSTLGSEAGAQRSLPSWPPPLGRFATPSAASALSARPREARPAQGLRVRRCPLQPAKGPPPAGGMPFFWRGGGEQYWGLNSGPKP
jgi:hypothetical protein